MSDFFQVRYPDDLFNYGDDPNLLFKSDKPVDDLKAIADKHMAALKADRELEEKRKAEQRERKVRYVSGLAEEAYLLYRAADLAKIKTGLPIEACVSLVTAAAITDALQSIDVSISATGG